MLVSNYTFNISKERISEWESFWQIILHQEWLRGENLRKMETYTLVNEAENDGKTYAIQAFFNEEEHLLLFQEYFESYLLPLIHRQLEGHYVYFQTILASWK